MSHSFVEWGLELPDVSGTTTAGRSNLTLVETLDARSSHFLTYFPTSLHIALLLCVLWVLY